MHHSVDHLITHANVDQTAHASTGWSKSVRIPGLLQLICGAEPSSTDTVQNGLAARWRFQWQQLERGTVYHLRRQTTTAMQLTAAVSAKDKSTSLPL